MARHHRSVEPQARQACYGRDQPVNSAAPCAPCVRGRPATRGSRRMHGDLHPWPHPWRHGWHVAPRPREGRRGLGARWLIRRRARNAADQVNERRAVYGRDLAGQREPDPVAMYWSQVVARELRAGISRSPRTAVAERRDQGVGTVLAAGPFLPDGRPPAIVSYQLLSCSPPPPVRAVLCLPTPSHETPWRRPHRE